ncbi:MAG TPA: hypothetical protein ENL31_00820, partial [Candidatus Aciduliprofundum boonei]|nr:hypothetical protein [Candidatus Aciduliprofundum boonei]
MKGYAGKLLDIDLSGEKICEIELAEKMLQFYGGRGLGTYLLWKE